MAEGLIGERRGRRSVGWGVFFLGLSALFALMAACARDPLKAALAGRFLPTENNRIINNYCQSCHVHRDFVPDRHVLDVIERYQVREFREARECRVCHQVNFRWFGPDHRVTRRPPDGSGG